MDFCVDCCLSSCKEHIVYCFQTCQKNYENNIDEHRRCNSECNELSDACQSNCTEVPSDSLSYMHKCITENGCGDYPFFRKDCLEQKKEDIFSCYSDFCSPLNKEKCIENADILYKHFLQSPLKDINKKYEIRQEEGEKKIKNQRSKNFFFLVIFLVILIVIKMIFFP